MNSNKKILDASYYVLVSSRPFISYAIQNTKKFFFF